MNARPDLSIRNPIIAAVYGVLMYSIAMSAYAAGGVTSNTDGLSVVTVFLNNISTILNAASVVVVTIAIVFSGYQIAFNNKRISEVAPVLLGGVLIGGAAQLANMLVASGTVGTVGTAPA